ncbi:hypothetical protein CAEBREN_19843 [Caenorhabditis brenneri]|uniref:Uncharacterized protein n=1 Tax=Caenorhabditis brenneri TaxID=135651 RepID=G0NPE7_CAEBE|nr:hypothetical protein CAEBREN_19843 [Caenorhabditis brenneri]
MNDKKGVPRLALTFAHEGADLVEPDSLEVIRKKMMKWFNKYPELSEYFKKPLPRNLIAISFPHVSFRMGKESCHDFKLANGHKEAENSFYTYRKLSESLQCAYYNEDGVEYLAGGCFYPTPHGKPKFLKSNDALLYFVTLSAIAYPLENRKTSYTFRRYKICGRFCATSGKNVLLDCGLEDGVPYHLEYNHVTHKYECYLCDECSEDYKNFKWEEPKNVNPATEKASAATPAIIEESAEASQARLVINDSDASAISCSSSTESLVESFNKVVSAAPAVIIEEASQARVAINDSESRVVSRASSTESLVKSFDKIDPVSEDVESDIDAELID